MEFGGLQMAHVEHGATLSTVGCAFENNTLFPDDHGAAVLEADASSVGTTALRLERSIFSGNTPEATLKLLAYNRAADAEAVAVYSDITSPDVCVYDGGDHVGVLPEECSMKTPQPLAAVVDTSMFLSASDSWLKLTQQVKALLTYLRMMRLM